MALVTMWIVVQVGKLLALVMLAFKTPLNEGKTNVAFKILGRGQERQVTRTLGVALSSALHNGSVSPCHVCPHKDVLSKFILLISFLRFKIQKMTSGSEKDRGALSPLDHTHSSHHR